VATFDLLEAIAPTLSRDSTAGRELSADIARCFCGTFAYEICFYGIYDYGIYIYKIYFYRALKFLNIVVLL
jgi:hypothetical protein